MRKNGRKAERGLSDTCKRPVFRCVTKSMWLAGRARRSDVWVGMGVFRRGLHPFYGVVIRGFVGEGCGGGDCFGGS